MTTPQKSGKPVAWVTMSLLGITIAVYVFEYLIELVGMPDMLFELGAKINSAIMQGEFWRLLTPIFLHGSIYHIAGNMYALYVLGPALERFYGSWRFALLYFLSGIAGNLVSFYLTPNPALGASSSIFGLIAAEAVFVFRNREFYGDQSRGMLRNILGLLLINLMIGLIPSANIDLWAHVGGLLGGLAFAWAAGPLLVVKWLPGGGYTVIEANSPRRFWLVGAAEFVVLIALAVIRVYRG